MSTAIPSPLTVDKTAETFRYYASTVYPERSSLYVHLAMRVAEDQEILEIAARASGKNALPNLFFSAAHLLLLKGEHHQLAAFYPSLNKTTRQYEYVYPYFRNFVIEHEEEIERIIRTRSVQTNEVARSAILVPAFEVVSREVKNRPLSLIEIGSSAGLTLLWDRYHFDYNGKMQCGPTDSPVKIECKLRGDKRPPIPTGFPKIFSRLGIDLNPIDLNDPESVQWLRALIWPEQLNRTRQLESAIGIARQDHPQIMKGDAVELLPELIDEIGRDAQVCVYQSFTLSLAGGEARERLDALLNMLSSTRRLFHVSLEWAKEFETPLLHLSRFDKGSRTDDTLAKSHAHGEWLEWLV